MNANLSLSTIELVPVRTLSQCWIVLAQFKESSSRMLEGSFCFFGDFWGKKKPWARLKHVQGTGTNKTANGMIKFS